jgi:hypothetical protein
MTLRRYITPPDSNAIVTNHAATLSATPGTNVPSGTPAHAVGAWTTLRTAVQIPHDLHELIFSPCGTGASATQTDALMDIAAGEAGSEVVIVENIPVGWGSVLTSFMPKQIVLPLFWPKATRLSSRVRGLRTTTNHNILLNTVSYRERPQTCFRGIDIIGGNPAASQGTSVTGGNTSAFAASWTNIGSPTTRKYHGVMPLIQGTMNGAATALSYWAEIGYGDAIIPGSPDWRFFMSNSEYSFGPLPNGFFRADIPANTQLQMRMACSGTAEATDMVIAAGYY